MGASAAPLVGHVTSSPDTPPSAAASSRSEELPLRQEQALAKVDPTGGAPKECSAPRKPAGMEPRHETKAGSVTDEAYESADEGGVPLPMMPPLESVETTSTLCNGRGELEERNEGPDVDFDDSTPLEVLDALIQNFQQNVKTALETRQFDRAEELQRRQIRHVAERNDICGGQHCLADMQLLLAIILKERESPEALNESRDITKALLGLGPITTAKAGWPAVSPEERMAQSICYRTLAEVEHREYCRTKDPKYLELYEKYAKRSFKLLLGIRLEAPSPFRESVGLLVQAYAELGRTVEEETYRQLYLNPSVSVLPPSSPLGSSSDISPPTSPGHGAQGHAVVLHEPNGMPCIISAICAGDMEKVGIQLQHGADVERRCPDGKTPLFYAVDGKYEAIIRRLKVEGAQINAISHGITVLHHAISQGSWEVVEVLLQLGADIELPDPNGATPLLRAVISKETKIVRVLCERGPHGKANLDARDQDGLTALHHAVKVGYDHEIARTLLRHGADANPHCTFSQKTPLHSTIDENNMASANFLLEECPEIQIEATDTRGRTPLALAVNQARYDHAEMLLDRGAVIERGKYPKSISPSIESLLKEAGRRRKVSR